MVKVLRVIIVIPLWKQAWVIRKEVGGSFLLVECHPLACVVVQIFWGYLSILSTQKPPTCFFPCFSTAPTQLLFPEPLPFCACWFSHYYVLICGMQPVILSLVSVPSSCPLYKTWRGVCGNPWKEQEGLQGSVMQDSNQSMVLKSRLRGIKPVAAFLVSSLWCLQKLAEYSALLCW